MLPGESWDIILERWAEGGYGGPVPASYNMSGTQQVLKCLFAGLLEEKYLEAIGL